MQYNKCAVHNERSTSQTTPRLMNLFHLLHNNLSTLLRQEIEKLYPLCVYFYIADHTVRLQLQLIVTSAFFNYVIYKGLKCVKYY